MRLRKTLILLDSMLAVGLVLYIAGFRLVTAEWPWQAGGNTANLILQEANAEAAPATHAVAAHGPTAPAASATPATGTHGTVQEGVLDSHVMSDTMHFLIYLPPGYADPAQAQQRYPVVYLLHGAPGDYHDWVKGGKAQQTADTLIAAGDIPPMILVMPDGRANMQVDSEWADGAPPAPQAESFLVNEVVPFEVVPFIDANYRTLADRDHRAIGGLSTGGYGAVNMTLHHPDVFSTAIGISGSYSTPKTVMGQQLFTTAASATYNSPVEYVRTITQPERVHIYLAVGTSDLLDNTQAETKAFDKALTAAHVPHQTQFAAGAHSWEFWGLHLVDGLKYFAATMATAQGA